MGDEVQPKEQLKINIEIPFPDKRTARIAYDVLRVDKEPKRSGVVKNLSVNETVLEAEFSALLARQLRVAINGFFDKLDLIAETIEAIGPPVSDSYSHY
ncbi:hypothetical protein NQ315_015752 [Exocentrus adspersus]|uniref:L antigen family member 3 n=1 Tax=Exocentrus adspersus TaxID=1586481 RepID=A0AAV8W3F2_9CUCU|nr:hypothetical protein NQ315_015752 [Exocentrus adspersus]